MKFLKNGMRFNSSRTHNARLVFKKVLKGFIIEMEEKDGLKIDEADFCSALKVERPIQDFLQDSICVETLSSFLGAHFKMW